MYIVEGNIGVGKSTFLNLVKKYEPDIDVALEPLTNWTQGQFGPSLLANFYHSPQRWAFTLETLAMICRARDHMSLQRKRKNTMILERSIYSGHYVFALNGKKNGFFSNVEWEIYSQWVDFLLQQRCNAPKGFIYLKADPEICYKRVRTRNRESEHDLTLSYIKQIDDAHTSFLLEKDDVFESIKDVPVLTLDCNDEFEDNPANMKKHLDKLHEFLTTHSTHIPTETTSTIPGIDKAFGHNKVT